MRLGGLAVTLALAVGGCASGPTGDRSQAPSPSRVDVRSAAWPDAVRIAAAGDIASSPTSGAGTASLVQSLDPDVVVTLGDNAYPDGSIEDFRSYYEPTWGAFRDITRPAPGNHEYHTPHAAGYFEYFQDQVQGDRYYAWNAGRWRMYSLNCEIACGKGSAQLAWLKKDLDGIGRRPALGYVHEPPFTCSVRHPPEPKAVRLWRALQAANGRIMLTGHNHGYERFATMRADGTRDATALREFVVGTGGAEFFELRSRCAHRQAQAEGVAGVLDLTLRRHGYSWRFVSVDGDVLDSGDRSIG
jgi:hypothetical protein